MNEFLLVFLGIAGSIFSGVVMFLLGKRWERNHQSLIIRAQMLEPIKNWLRGTEKFIGILGDTLSSVSIDSPSPLTYDLEERRKSAQFMIENTNEVLGILDSESLVTKKTTELAHELTKTVQELDHEVKHTLLPLDHEILDRNIKGMLTLDFVRYVGETKISLEKKVQKAYSLISKIKTKLN